MAISKLILNGVTQMDLTQDTVDAASSLSGKTGHGADGEGFTGSYAAPTPKTESDVTVSGATVTIPAGAYASQVQKSVASGSATTPATTVSVTPSISVSSGGLITATASGTKSVTPTVSAGYVSSGTAGTITVSGSNTSQLTTLEATTYNTSSSDQTISSGRYLTGNQTIRGVTVSGLNASDIASGVTVKVGDSADDDRIASVTGALEFITYYTGNTTPSSSLGQNGDIYLDTSGGGGGSGDTTWQDPLVKITVVVQGSYSNIIMFGSFFSSATHSNLGTIGPQYGTSHDVFIPRLRGDNGVVFVWNRLDGNNYDMQIVTESSSGITPLLVSPQGCIIECEPNATLVVTGRHTN